MKDKYEGEPKLYLTADGANISYKNGQPVMEQGFENQILISLFTRPRWCGNVFLLPENKIGSDFEAVCARSITRSKLADIENAAVRSLAGKSFSRVSAEAANPKADNLRIDISIEGAPALSLGREGIRWKKQQEHG